MARWRPVWLAGFATLALSCGEGATEDGVTITEEMRAAVVRDSVPAPKANRTSAKIKPLVQDHAQAKLATSPSPAPAEERFPLYGTADYLFANIYRRMEMEENILGYMRRGTSFRARWTGERRGCRSGWAELANGGYICSGRGFTVTTEPFEPENAPIPPAVHDALPYAYGYTVRDNVPQYGELPDKQTEGEVFTAIRALRAWESNRAAEAVSTAVGPDGGVAAPAYAPVISRSPAGLFNLPEGAPRLPDALRAMMLKGFYVSLDGAIAAPSGDMFLRTVRGTFVRQDDLIMNTPPASRGVILGGDWQLPIAITHRKGMRATRLDPATNAPLGKESVDRHRAFRIAQPDFIYEDRRYVRTADGTLLRPEMTRVVRATPRPPGIPANAKWIHVSLADQSLVAYEGEKAMFATLVSSGKPGFETPTGLYRIQSKQVSATMDDFASPEGAYSIEDVPWTMYFHGNFALHGAFWHYTFGNVRSHGCVNLSPADARWLFEWSTPSLPPTWHAIYSDGARPGTFVYITP